MLFHSLEFFIFLPIVFTMYWVIRDLKVQNVFILSASYFFYGWWDYRFLFLLLVSTVADFFLGRLIYQSSSDKLRSVFLWCSVIINLGILGFFKYFDFFLNSLSASFSFMGHPIEMRGLEIVLPVGISFYTFQTLSYTIDIYKRKIAPTSDIISFAAYVSFFPQLVAGPIERARRLLPQFTLQRKFETSRAIDGSKQILWGFFKKWVIADNCALLADTFFNEPHLYPGSGLLLGAFFFSFQIYADFSGYSDMAIGIARLFGFDLSKNFAFPYFSRDIAEFWRRWHISLTTWFRDYLYIPLGGNRGSTWLSIRNVFLVFMISGFWHGANFTFIVWGILHAVCFLPLMLATTHRRHLNVVAEGSYIPTFTQLIQMVFTFILVTLLWIFFRSENIGLAFLMIGKIFSASLFEMPQFELEGLAAITLFAIFFLMMVEWIGRNT
ncbi:MAG: MBOAT family O-acyltransferase, partial [Saprospiraceae bacterium]